MTGTLEPPTVVLLHGQVEVASWRLESHGRPSLAMVDEVARLQLAAHAVGCSIRLQNACIELWELLDLPGWRSSWAAPQPSRWAGRPNAAKRVVSRKL